MALAVTAIAVAVRATSQMVVAPSASDTQERGEPRLVKDWEEALSLAARIAGNDTAPVTILALVDLQCPACRGFHKTAVELATERPDDVQLLYVHHPLSYHPYALPAARAAECARHEGLDALARWVEAVFAAQDSLGTRSWAQYAEDAGLPDPERIEACVDDSGRDPRIRAGLDFGQRIEMTGTPTVLLNGWQYPDPPSREALRAAVESFLKGDSRP